MQTTIPYSPGVTPSREMYDYLADRFCEFSIRIGNSETVSEQWLLILGTYYRNPNRYLHNLGRIYYILQVLDDKSDTNETRDIFEAAVWFHNMVFTPGTVSDPSDITRNRTAAFQFVKGTSLQNKYSTISNLISYAAYHETFHHSDVIVAPFMEMVMFILGEDQAVYNVMVQASRAEYPGLTDIQFTAYRKVYLGNLLRNFLTTPRTPKFMVQRDRILINVRKELESYG